MENAYSNKCLLDVFNIKNEKEWYHIRINSCLPACFLKNSVFSGIMLVGNDITDNGDDDECFIFFSSYKALYIHRDNLIPYEINEKQFTEFDKPEELHIKDITILGIFRSTIVLLHNLVSEDSTFSYVVSYNERLQLTFFKKTDLTVSLNDNLLSHPLSNLAELGKIFLVASGNSILVIDFRTLQVSQILECSLPFLPTGSFKMSKYDKMLNVVHHDGHVDQQRWYLKYALCNGRTLQELALEFIAETFSIKRIQSSNLPQSLLREIIARKTGRKTTHFCSNRNNKNSDCHGLHFSALINS